MARYSASKQDDFTKFSEGYFGLTKPTREARGDCRDFFFANYDDLLLAAGGGVTWHRLGEDFYLSRNGHGAGYFDEKYRGEAADRALDRLQKAAKVYGSTDDDSDDE